ncbi:hypothetical protein, partial [Actinophytocola sp.]|uniref:hypothetical protein n=1 Tax=Actinophytocola sp. TaxID=1872138 RepID=UPI00389B0FE0
MSDRWNRPMLVFAFACAALAAVAVVGVLADHRTLDGLPIWTKPLKFAVSGAVYGLTWSWLCSLIDHRQRTVRRASGVVVALLSLELVLITGQALRGRRSHFNFSTTFDAVVYEVMATSIVVVWCGALVLTLLVLRSDIEDGARKLAVGLGAVLSLVGVGMGVLMTIPSGAQIAALGSGGGMLGAHTVGAPDGGPGLPVLGWSTTAGDLRVPHFVGMHALQALLLWHLALGRLARRWPRLGPVRAQLVCVGAAGFAGLLALLTWQAYRGQPLTRPDGWTLAGFAGGGGRGG